MNLVDCLMNIYIEACDPDTTENVLAYVQDFINYLSYTDIEDYIQAMHDDAIYFDANTYSFEIKEEIKES